MSERRVPTKEEVQSYLRDRRNWGRWGDNGGAGAMNLITAEKRLSAVDLVKTGRTVSLSRGLPTTGSLENPSPALHFTRRYDLPQGWGAAEDYYGILYHGMSCTHIDTLCHVWNQDGGWEGRDPSDVITFHGARYGSVDEWSDGILTRGVLLDVPKHRGAPFVTLDEPVHGWELEDIVAEEGIELEPGDAVMVYCGREAFAEQNGGIYCDWALVAEGLAQRPGLHASCLPFIRNSDMAVLGWDMLDVVLAEYDMPWPVHVGAIASYGVALLDNALLEDLARVCAEEDRYEFMVTINPLKVSGGTGSPVNPVAVF